MTPDDSLREFHNIFSPAITAASRRSRATLLTEEYREVIQALQSGDRENLAKELADLMYIVHGTALMHGIDLDGAFAAVHRSNMSKANRCECHMNSPAPPKQDCPHCHGTGLVPLLREDGKVLKGNDYREPDMSSYVNALPDNINDTHYGS